MQRTMVGRGEAPQPARTGGDAPKLPTFLIVGASKCGTTSLAAYLSAHPHVFMCRPKEPSFFSHRWSRGLAWYEGLFAEAAGFRAVGEASVSYSKAPLVPDVPSRIASILPDVRIVYLVRHPIERIRSDFRDRVHRGVETAGRLREALGREPIYLQTTRYGYQLDRYLEHFDRDRILVLPTDRLRNERACMVAQVLDFIGLDGDVLPPNLEAELNKGDEKARVAGWAEGPRAVWRRMAPVTRKIPRRWRERLHARLSRPMDPQALEVPPELEREIWQELQPDLERLRAIVGPDFDLWGRA